MEAFMDQFNNDIIENPNLKAAIKDLQIDTQNKTPDNFYNELFKAKLLIPIIPKEENKVDIIKIKNSEDKQFLAAFTDMESADLSKSKDQYIAFTIQNYIEVIQENTDIEGVVINPYSENLVLTKANLKYIEEQLNIRKENEILIGIPKVYPQELVDSCIAFFNKNKNKEIKKAFLLQLIRDNVPSLLIIIDTDEDEAFMQSLGAELQPMLENNQKMEIMLYNSNIDFSNDVTADREPFYTMD